MLAATVVIMMLVSGVTVLVAGVGSNTTADAESSQPPVELCTAHAPIRINSNAEFDAAHGVTGGGGTETNPYIIENYYINGSGYGYCIYIGNTTDYFVVRNCSLHDASANGNIYYWNSGIDLYNVKNAHIENNTVSSNGDNGIYLSSSNNNTIRNNKLTHHLSSPLNASSNEGSGIYLESSCNNTILNNNASNNGRGISLYYSINNTLTTNNASANVYGMYLKSSSNNLLTGNTVSSNFDYGIYLDSSSSNSILKNGAPDNVDGIYLYYSESNIISNNSALNNGYGVYLCFSRENKLSNNNATNNSRGIYLYSSNNNIIIENNVSNNGDGIYLAGSVNNSIFLNNIINNTNQGYDDTGNNSWNASYPSGGNYWSDYNGTDACSGPGQNLSGSDGIGDSPYTNISGDSGALDNYPLMQPIENAQQSFDISVHTGWNLISYPLLASGDIETVLNDDIVWDYAQWYDPSDAGDHWKTHVMGRVANDLNTIDNTMGIWLHITDAGDGYLTITGQSPNSTVIPLHAGWNLVSYPSSSLAAMSQAGLPAEVTKIAKYDSNAAYLVSEVTDWIGTNFVPGRGYWLYATADTAWTVNY